MVALSVSSSMTGCSFLTVSPTLTSTLATSPDATFSPSSGTLNSVTYDTAGLDFSGSIPRSLIAFCTTAGLDHAVAREIAERRDDDEPGIHLEELAQRGTALAAAEAVGAERRDAPRHPAVDGVGHRLDVVGRDHDDAFGLLEALGHVGHLRRLAGVQPVPALAGVAVAIELLEARGAPHVGRHVVVLLEHLLGLEHLVEDGAGANQLRPALRLLLRRGPQLVEPLQDAVARAFGHRQHLVGLVHHGEVVEDALAVLVHAADAVFDDHRDLVGKRRVVRDQVRHGQRQQVAVAVLVLEPFARQGRPARRAAQQEPARARVGRGPDQVADALHPEHRVVDEERNRVHAVRGIGAAGGDERRRSSPPR